MSRLQINYDYLIWFVVELIQVADKDKRAYLLGECVLNLPDESLHDIKDELMGMRADERLMKVVA